jgi:fructose-bisphosphate aldolase class II
MDFTGGRMSQFKNILEEAQRRGVAVGHFNVSDWVLIKAVCASARELRVPVIVGASEGERTFLGVTQIAAVVKSLREEHGYSIFLNADHTHSLGSAVAAAKAGFDSVVYDLSALPFEENVKQTRQGVEELKSISPNIVVEGEIGNIGIGSEIHESAPASAKTLTTPEEAKQFADSTGIDILAPAVGNSHGMLQSMVKGEAKKRLDIKRILEIKRASGSLLTLHGGSGTNDRDLQDAIVAGINIIHINTEVRIAWRRSLEDALANNPNEIVPYKLLPAVEEAVKQVILPRLRLFNQALGHSSTHQF